MPVSICGKFKIVPDGTESSAIMKIINRKGRHGARLDIGGMVIN